jgi:rod shape-determining protein MreC
VTSLHEILSIDASSLSVSQAEEYHLRRSLSRGNRHKTWPAVSPVLNRYRDLAIVVVLLAFPFLTLRANMRHQEDLNALDRLLLRVSAPFQSFFAGLARGTSNVLGDYFYLVDVKSENEKLAYDNARLRETVHSLEQAKAENQELRRLLQLRETTPGDTVSAVVVGRDFNEFFRVMNVRLDPGSRDIRTHMAVIAPEGVVGSVIRVGGGDGVGIELAADASFGLDVEDERTHAGGYVRGTGDPARYTCKVEYVDARDEIKEGDELVTSGKGKWFPRGIPVAHVTKVVKRELGRDQEVEAAPTVNFSRLNYVLILVTPPSDELAPETPKTPKKTDGK